MPVSMIICSIGSSYSSSPPSSFRSMSSIAFLQGRRCTTIPRHEANDLDSPLLPRARLSAEDRDAYRDDNGSAAKEDDESRASYPRLDQRQRLERARMGRSAT